MGVISTLLEKYPPIMEPINIATAINVKFNLVPRIIVTIIAISIPKDATLFPFLAVFGWLNIFNPYIKHTAEIK